MIKASISLLVVAAAVACVALMVGVASAATDPRPTLTITSVTLKRAQPRDGFAGTARAFVRICAVVGPRAVVLVRETRMAGGKTTARASWIDPLGVDLDRMLPYGCFNRMLGWAVAARFNIGSGRYVTSIRVRDGHRRVTPAVSFAWSAAPPR